MVLDERRRVGGQVYTKNRTILRIKIYSIATLGTRGFDQVRTERLPGDGVGALVELARVLHGCDEGLGAELCGCGSGFERCRCPELSTQQGKKRQCQPKCAYVEERWRGKGGMRDWGINTWRVSFRR